jgi:asparagine synthase (glutamine-hydrolysing)
MLVYNGEVYNHLDIRLKLEAVRQVQTSWRGHSDTETLLAAIEQWGLEQTLRHCLGMFALALWDRRDRVLTLARDRMGEKPLYYGWQNGVLLFGSELKALRVHPRFLGEIDRDVLPLYLRHGYIPAPWSIYKGIRKLMPGTWVGFAASQRSEFPEPNPYWSLADAITKAQADPFDGCDEEAIDALEQQLLQAIAGQRLADVPLGAFLSGGIDSSTVVALMQAKSDRPIKTFTIGFDEAGYNEAQHAKAVAKHLGTDHTELYVTPSQTQDVIPNLARIYDEPFGDSSAIPTFLVSQMARQHVTVALSGDGGDELFGGYSRYSSFQRWHQRTAALPKRIRSLMRDGIQLLPFRAGGRFHRRQALLAGVLGAEHSAELYRVLTGHWLPADAIVQDPSEASYWLNKDAISKKFNEPLDHAMLADMMTYLPDDILVKVDRAAMAASLETRVPLLDHRIVEWSWSLPQRLKARGGHEKWVLKQLLHRHVPSALMDRPKMGFGVPTGDWLRGPLRDWAEELLSFTRLAQGGFLDPINIRCIWNQHVAGRGDCRDMLWIILMWQAFQESIEPEGAV